MTARNVRAYQTKGLLPPPTRQGRRSVYGPDHLQRLLAIERARARGASLSLIVSHLAEGRPLDEDTLVRWRPDAGPSGSQDGETPARRQRTEIGALLATLDHQRDPAAQGRIEELIAAGVFQQEGRRVYTGRDLATALQALQRQGLPVESALGVAQRALTAAVPIADSVRRSMSELEGAPAAAADHLGAVVCCVVRHVMVVQVPG
jgi:DNA-binding transcriptional MerR regulator